MLRCRAALAAAGLRCAHRHSPPTVLLLKPSHSPPVLFILRCRQCTAARACSSVHLGDLVTIASKSCAASAAGEAGGTGPAPPGEAPCLALCGLCCCCCCCWSLSRCGQAITGPLLPLPALLRLGTGGGEGAAAGLWRWSRGLTSRLACPGCGCSRKGADGASRDDLGVVGPLPTRMRGSSITRSRSSSSAACACAAALPLLSLSSYATLV